MRSLVINLCLLALALAGASCSSKPTAPSYTYRVPEVVAVDVPDSVALSQTFDVRVFWINDGCDQLSQLETLTRSDTLYLTPIVKTAIGSACSGRRWVTEAVQANIHAAHLPRGPIYVVVQHTGIPFVLPVEVGSAPAAIKRVAVQVVDRDTGHPVTTLVQVDAVFSVGLVNYPVLRDTTDQRGMADTSWSCTRYYPPLGWPLSTRVDWYTFEWPNWFDGTSSAECGIPHRMVFRVRKL